MGWARLLERVFGIDIEHCPQYGGDLKIIAAIEDPAVRAMQYSAVVKFSIGVRLVPQW